MILALMALGLGVGAAYMGMKFYRSIDWNEPAEPGPDLRAIRQRVAELQHIQSVLAEAHQQGKLSRSLVDEYDRYCADEIHNLQADLKRPKN